MSRGSRGSGIETMFGGLFDQFRMMHTGWTVILGFGFAASFLLWGYFLFFEDGIRRKILLVEGIVTIILLAAHLYRVFFIGYDDRLWRNFKMVYIPHLIMSLIGFFIAEASFIGVPDSSQQTMLYFFMRFMTNVVAALMMSLLPGLLLTLLIWMLMQTVEFFRRP